MQSPVFAALVHYPIVDKHDHVVSTSITNLDIHDISRAARTYGLQRYYLVTPIEAQLLLTRKIILHWEEGWGAGYNPNRKDALGMIEVKPDLGQVGDAIERQCGRAPLWVATSARRYPNTVGFAELRGRLQHGDGRPVCLVFGTGWGLHRDLVLDCDLILEPIEGPTDYNHLSVRSAASIIFDRLLGTPR